MNKNKIIAVAAIGVLIVIFAVVVIVNLQRGKAAQTESDNVMETNEQVELNQNEIASTTLTATSSEALTSPAKIGTRITTGAVSGGYTDALKTYGASGYRMQFVSCGATPAQLTVKTGQKFMLDNRDSEAHKIGIGSKTYSVGSYNYVIATASKTVGMVYVTCDGVRTAKILVQP